MISLSGDDAMQGEFPRLRACKRFSRLRKCRNELECRMMRFDFYPVQADGFVMEPSLVKTSEPFNFRQHGDPIPPIKRC